jgi:hypothetical protein
MQLALDPEEAALLVQVLERHLSDMREEIGKTENYDWRKGLQADEQKIKAMLARLQETASLA